MCSSTSATTAASATVGAPTVILPSWLINNTRSKVTGCPASTARRSISNRSPALTRYCLLPVSNTAYINISRENGERIDHKTKALSTPHFWVPHFWDGHFWDDPVRRCP